MDKIKPNIITQIFVLILIVFFGGMIFWEMMPYLSGILGAITLYVLLNSYQAKLENKGLKPSLAAFLLMLASILIFLIPASLFVLLLFTKVRGVINNPDKYINIIKEKINWIEQTLGFQIQKGDSVSKAAEWFSQHMGSFLGSALTIVVAIGIMYFLLYYMLVYRKKMTDALINYFPLSNKNIEVIAAESDILIKANAIGIPIVAISQGIISLIGYLIVGAPDPMLWFLVATVTSFIPYGTTIGILPVSIILFSQGDNWGGVFILIYGAAIVGSTDNLLRMTVLKKIENVHPLITLIGVIIGIPLFGFFGIIFGPVLLSLFLLMVKLYKKGYGST